MKISDEQLGILPRKSGNRQLKMIPTGAKNNGQPTFPLAWLRGTNGYRCAGSFRRQIKKASAA
jgi:hypothetical protein